MAKKNLRFVIALYVEARQLLEHYNLSKYKLQNCSYKIYFNLDLNIWLVISGVGNENANKATRLLHQNSPKSKKNIWINIGMAGSRNYSLGKIYDVKKITYLDKCYFTSSLVNHIIKPAEVICIDRVEKIFPIKNTLYEMETFGFISAAESICDRELICSLKIVSDNKKNQPSDFVKKTNIYIKSNLNKITKLIDTYAKISNQISNDVNCNLDLVQEKFYLTFSYKIILKDLILKFEKIYSKKHLEKLVYDSKNIKELINKIKNKIKIHVIKI